MKKWKENNFNDFIKLNRGFDLTESNVEEGIYPVVTSTNIKAYHKYFKVDPPGVVTGRSGSLGVVQYINEKYWPHNTALYVKDFKGNFPKYVYYFLKVLKLENFNAGTGVPTLNQNHLHKLKIKIPPLPIQKKITAILSAYDDLIEKNNRRISILEKMAEELYREWFVRLRFPGYEKTKIKNGIPEGWEVKRLGDMIDKQNGFAFESKYYMEKGYRIIRTQDFALTKYINLDGNVFISEDKAEEYKRYNLQYLDYLMVMVGASLGKCGIVFKKDIPALQNQNMWVFRPKTNSQLSKEFLYFLLPSVTKDVLNHATGAAREFFRQDNFLNKNIVVPHNKIIKMYNNAASVLLERIDIMLSQINILTSTRDRLLSRLLSGKIDVENLDIKFPDSMKDDA